MKNPIVLLLIFGLASSLSAQQTAVFNQQLQLNISREMIDNQRNKAIGFNMTFTQQEKEKFWPLYREYRGAMHKVGDKRVAVILDYAENFESMTDSLARNLMDRSLEAESERIKVKKKYVAKLRRILPETKVVRLMQIESRMDTLVDLKIAESLPLMEGVGSE